MIQRLVGFAVRYRGVILLLTAGLVAIGLLAFQRLSIEAYPNPVPPLVEVIVQPPGWSAEEVERYVTVPVEVGLSGMPGLEHIRSQSLFGLSDVKCYFRWGTRYEDARQEVLNRLAQTPLAGGLQARLSPWNAIGEVFRYTVVDAAYDGERERIRATADPATRDAKLQELRERTLRKLKTIQDWVLEREFKQVPGVIDVTSFGGLTKEYHVEVDPVRLKGRGATLATLTAAIANANQNVGGQRITIGEQAYTVRGIGLIESTSDIGDIVIFAQRGIPVRVRDVADVSIGSAPRLGVVGKDDEPDVVQGIVLMRYGNETAKTLRGVHERLEHIRKHVLPPELGVEIRPYYDRGDLVQLTTRTVLENLAIGMALVSLVLLVFLGNLRAAVVTALNIPLALLVAFAGMVVTGQSANLISIGAVDFGIVIDSTVIMVESIYRHLGAHGHGTTSERIWNAAGEVGRPMAFATLIIGVAFLPLFTMTGVSGVIFSPMAWTYALAIGGSIVLALTLTPALASWLPSSPAEEKESLLMRGARRLYSPLFAAAVRRPALAAGIVLVPVLACTVLLHFLGGEFMPKLEEGNFWIRATLPMSVSLEESAKHVGRMRAILRKHREVLTVVSQLGRPDDGTDIAGFFNIELFAPLRPFGDWPRGLTKEKLTEELSGELQGAFPGVVFNFSQMISDNVEEAVSGVKGENSVKVFGPRIERNEATADAISDVMSQVPGVQDLGVFRSMGQPSIKIVPDRLLCERYGLNTGDVEAVVEAAIGGHAVTQVYEGEKSFQLTVRWMEPFRNSVSAIRKIGVAAPDGSQIPLGQLATITEEGSPSIIYREDLRRYSPVKFSVRGRDLTKTISEAQASLAQKVPLPPETHLDWAGEINELNDAVDRLYVVLPLTLILIAFLVYGAVKTWVDTLVVLLSIPLACSGGVLALMVTGTAFSVSAAMGFISIFGVALQGSILVVTDAQRQWARGASLEEGARAAAEVWLRPVLMATLVAMLGLLPAALSNGIGAQAQKPLAIVVIGGALVLAAVTQVLLPPLLVLAHRWFGRAGPTGQPAA